MGLRQVLFSTIGVIALLGTLGAGTAFAAPSNSPNTQIVPLQCDDGQSYTVAVPGNGPLTPGIILDGGSGNLIPVSIDVTITITDSNGSIVESDHEASTKPGRMNGVQSDLMSCTFNQSMTGNGQTFTVAGTVVVFKTPRG